MASPARDARLRFSASGFTEIVSRGKGSLCARKPGTRENVLETQVGNIGWHYGADLEVDTAWEVDTGAWQYRMLKADYNLHSRDVLNVGTLIEYREPVSNQWVALQPLALNWVNSQDSRQQLALPQAVAAQVIDDVLYWPNGYGSGRHFRYRADSSKLVKEIVLDTTGYTSLPTPTVTGTPFLEIEFILSKSTGVTEWVDGTQWDRSTKINTASRIEYRTPGGAVLWVFDYPRVKDDNGNEFIGQFQLRRQGANRYCTVRIPKSWLDTAVFPVIIDPTIDTAVGTGVDDGEHISTTTFANTATTMGVDDSLRRCWTRYTFSAISGTVTASYIRMNHSNANTAIIKANADDQASPSAPTSASDANGRTLTTADSGNWSANAGKNNWTQSPSLNSIFSELITSYTSITVVQFFMSFVDYLASGFISFKTIENSGGGFAPTLHVEFTESAAGSYVISRKSKTYIRR